MNLKDYFNQSYKEPSSKKWKWSVVLSIGLFIFLFLFIFKPSNYISDQEPGEQFLISFGFGLVTSAILFIFKFILEPKVITDKWTLGKSIIWGLIISACIGAASFFYIVIIFENNFKIQYIDIYLKYFIYSVFTAILIGSIPITIRHLVTYNRKYKKALKDAGLYEESLYAWEDEIIITAGNRKNNFTFEPKKITHMVSDDNYISIFSLKGDTLNKILIRGTLKALEKELKSHKQFVRCHKSYIINLKYLIKITGNSQNMKLTLAPSDIKIPVSRSKARYFTEKRKQSNSFLI